MVSDATREELADVLSCPKFDRYVSLEDRQEFIRVLNRMSEPVIVTSPVKACRDPKDDTFLEGALNGEADVIVTGDQDLRVLPPFRGVEILSPRECRKG